MPYRENKLIITVALSGGTTREQTPHVPITPEEIANSAVEAAKAGATIAHFHARDAKGRQTSDPATNAAIIKHIREKSDMIINPTVSGSTYEARKRVLELNPEMATLNMGSTNRGLSTQIIPNNELEDAAKEMQARNIRPDLMIQTWGFIQNAKKLIDKGLIKQPAGYHFFFGGWDRGTMDLSMKTLLYLVDSIPPGSIWATAAHGEDAYTAAALAIVNGGHARIGMEDCIYISKGKLATSDAQEVAKVVKLAHELDVEVASIKETRAILNLPPPR